eukprot:jgi/Orpsp1_1/1175472/evm.model.c7180000054023.2
MFPFPILIERNSNPIVNNIIQITPEYKIEFERKVNQFRLQPSMKILNSNTFISIHRDNLFDDAYTAIMNKSPIDLKKRLKIVYIGEVGIDAGGLLRDFFYQISKKIGNPNYSLFQYPHDNSYELEINPKSNVANPDHLNYFRFVGRIIGLAIFHKQYLPINFTMLFIKKLCNMKFNFSDLEFVDPMVYKNIKWM